jgi:hypothetical protein
MTYRTQINSSSLANLPPNGQSGDLYLPTNGIATYQNNGTSWQSWGPLITTITPTASNTSFNWYNQGTATQTFNSAGMLVSVPGTSTSIFLAQPNSNVTSGFVESAGIYTITGALASSSIPMDNGVAMYNTATSVSVQINQVFDLDNAVPRYYLYYTGTHVTSTNMIGLGPGGPVFVKLTIVGSNIIGSFSRDRVNYLQVFSIALSTVFPTAPTSSTFQTGVVVSASGNATYTNNVNFIHYTQG